MTVPTLNRAPALRRVLGEALPRPGRLGTAGAGAAELPGGRVVPVAVVGSDGLGCAGAVAVLRAHAGIRVTSAQDLDARGVVVVIAARVGPDDLRQVKELARANGTPSLLVTDRLADRDLLPAVACGVAAVLPRTHLEAHDLLAAVLSVASGSSHLPPRLQGALTRHLRRVDADVLGPLGLTLSGLTTGELDVLRLVGEGLTPAEVARRLRCSQRAVEQHLAEVMRRNGLRTHAQAVAHAIRTGAI